jgi:hypothetical protein
MYKAGGGGPGPTGHGEQFLRAAKRSTMENESYPPLRSRNGNAEHRTVNVERPMSKQGLRSMFDVDCSMLDILHLPATVCRRNRRHTELSAYFSGGGTIGLISKDCSKKRSARRTLRLRYSCQPSTCHFRFGGYCLGPGSGVAPLAQKLISKGCTSSIGLLDFGLVCWRDQFVAWEAL